MPDRSETSKPKPSCPTRAEEKNPHDPKATGLAPRDPKAERLADALRANLKRRKAADRARRDRADSEPPLDGER